MEKIIKKGIIIGVVVGSFIATTELFASGSVTGVGTDTLTVTSDFTDGDRVLDYIGETSVGFYAPITSSPQTITVTNESGASSTSTPVRFIETSTGCFGVPLNFTDCLATGIQLGATDGYYIDTGVWYEVGTEPPIYGCTDPEANNYDPDATEDDDSCTYDTPTDPDISENTEKEIVYTFYILLISVSTGLICGIFALLFYASLAIIRQRN